MFTVQQMGREYILTDANGYPYNSEFKPDLEKYGDLYHGYQTNNQEALFYYFAVLGYDLQFTYGQTTYYFLSTEDYVARTDENYQQDLEVFADANEMLKAFQIEGAPLYQIADELKNVDIL